MTNSTRYLLALISIILSIALVFINAVAFHKSGFFSDTADLLQQVIPNLIASLLVFLFVYFFIERRIENNSASVLDSVHQLTYFTSPTKEFTEYTDRSDDFLQKIISELSATRDNIKREIYAALDEINQSQNTINQKNQEVKLQRLYSKLSDIEQRLARLSEKSAIMDRDKTISELKDEINRLNGIIQKNRSLATDIVKSAEKA